MLIKGKRVYLDLMEQSDAGQVQEWLNEYEIRKLCFAECPMPVDLDGALSWIREMNSGVQSRLLAIRRIERKDLIGFVTVRKLSYISKSVRFGSLIWPPELQNQGLGSEARKIFLEYAYSQLGLRRVYGCFAAYNAASRRSHEKLGAVISATTRQSVFVDGQFYDVHHYTYQRERFPGLEADQIFTNKTFKRVNLETLTGELERLYQDYYGLPSPDTDARIDWLRQRPGVNTSGAGAAVFLIQPILQNADILFFPGQDGTLSSELIRISIEKGFAEYNLHRLQVCLPASAVDWQNQLLEQGFLIEGKLDGVLYAKGNYGDLIFFGKLREE